MAKLINCDMEYFLEYIKTKRIVVFGFGRKASYFIPSYSLEDKIEFIIDNDISKQGTEVVINNISIKVEGIQKLIEYHKSPFIILIINDYSTFQIMEQLNSYDVLDQIECFSANFMQDNCKPEVVIYTKGDPIIPKVIHYCWFGENPIPEKLLEYMETWKEFCPDYEIIRWDESNYDVHKNTYMSQAYKCKKWGFVPDYARLDIVATYGGIYLDTDVEIVKSFDDLLMDRSFFGYVNYGFVNAGSGFGSVAGNELLLQMRDHYNDKTFINKDGTMNLLTCLHYQKEVLIEYGFIMNNKQQKINGNVLYPKEVFSPVGVSGIYELLTDNTHSIHRGVFSWENDRNVQDLLNTRQYYRSLWNKK